MIVIIGGLAGGLMIAGMIYLLIRFTGFKKRQSCPKGQWTTVISNFGTGMPRTFHITLSAVGGAVEGTYTEQKYLWILPMTPKEGKLAPEMTFTRDWINGLYSLKFRPENADVDITIS